MDDPEVELYPEAVFATRPCLFAQLPAIDPILPPPDALKWPVYGLFS
jgi:hypothetical protein